MNEAKSVPEPRLFTLIRHADAVGVSGTGRVLDGVIWHNGQVTICWRSDLRGGDSSLTIYDTLDAFLHIHVDPHPKEQSTLVYSSWPKFDQKE